MRKLLIILAACLGLALPLVPAIPAQAALTCDEYTSVWAATKEAPKSGSDPDNPRLVDIKAKVHYRQCYNTEGGQPFIKALWIRGEYNLHGTTYGCDNSWNPDWLGVRFNWSGQELGYNPEPFEVKCAADTTNGKTVDISSQTSRVYRDPGDPYSWFWDGVGEHILDGGFVDPNFGFGAWYKNA